METGDLVAEGLPVFLPGGSGGQFYPIDFNLAAVVETPAYMGASLLATLRMLNPTIAAGTRLRILNANVSAMKLTPGGGVLIPGAIGAGARRSGAYRRGDTVSGSASGSPVENTSGGYAGGGGNY